VDTATRGLSRIRLMQLDEDTMTVAKRLHPCMSHGEGLEGFNSV
jgi:hypothetical protein